MSVDKQLLDALECLYEENKSYIEVNNLGDAHHNQSMKLARAAIKAAKAEAEVDVETRWMVKVRSTQENGPSWYREFMTKDEAVAYAERGNFDDLIRTIERLDITTTLVEYQGKDK